MKTFLCLAALLVASAYGGDTAVKKSAATATTDKKIPLEKKLDKRGLLELGYGYGHSGLDIGYLGHGSIASHNYGYGHADFGHIGSYGHIGGYGHIGHSAPAEFLINKHADVHKTITLTKGVP